MVLSTLAEDQAAPSEPAEEGAEVKVIDIDSARRKVKKSFARSSLGIEKDVLFPRLSYGELKVGHVLGKGGFGTVREILSITPKKEYCNQGSFSFRSWADITGSGNGTAPSQDEDHYVPDFDPDFDESEFQSKKFIADYCTGRNGEARYVIKAISPEVKKDARKFLRAAMDMAVETQFLSVLDHPHLIKLRAVGNGDMFDKDYFLVLDRLYDTLDDRIEKWILQLKQAKTCMGKLRGGKTKKKKLFAERLSVAKNLASAMDHLHGLNIIYRDLKPENIGFDVKNVVKLFDFGLAKELHPDQKSSNGAYSLTPCTGSRRYMAPEVANKYQYNLSVDVYSFGLLLWEVLSMKIPFEGYNEAMFTEMVANFGDRPKVNDSWPPNLIKLTKQCWDGHSKKRPLMSEVVTCLEKEIATLS